MPAFKSFTLARTIDGGLGDHVRHTYSGSSSSNHCSTTIVRAFIHLVVFISKI